MRAVVFATFMVEAEDETLAAEAAWVVLGQNFTEVRVEKVEPLDDPPLDGDENPPYGHRDLGDAADEAYERHGDR